MDAHGRVSICNVSGVNCGQEVDCETMPHYGGRRTKTLSHMRVLPAQNVFQFPTISRYFMTKYVILYMYVCVYGSA